MWSVPSVTPLPIAWRLRSLSCVGGCSQMSAVCCSNESRLRERSSVSLCVSSSVGMTFHKIRSSER
jgi:hypothetical protein